MHHNTIVNICEPHSIQDPKGSHQHHPYACYQILVTLMTSSTAEWININLVHCWFKEHRECITFVASVQTPMMGVSKRFCPSWQFIRLISLVFILGPISMNRKIYLSKQWMILPSTVTDTGRPNLIILSMVFSEFTEAFPGKTHQIPPPETDDDPMCTRIMAVLWFGAPYLTWLKQYLWYTWTLKANGEKLTLWVHWLRTQWHIEYVSTPSPSHFLLLISAFIFHSDTHQLWHSTLTLTLSMTIILTPPSTTTFSVTIVLQFIAQWVPLGVPAWRNHLSTTGR